MIKMKDIGNFKTVPQIISDIIGSDLSALDAHLASGWDINKNIAIGRYTEESPLDYALIMNAYGSVRWLTEHGAELNRKESPAFLTAVRYGNEEIVRYLVSKGAKIHMKNNVDTEAYQQALYGKNLDILPLIQELGHRVEQYGGAAFRSAVNERNYKALDFFLAHGVDIDYNKPDSVYPFKPTPLCVAARYVDIKMCKYLVEHGADVTISEQKGMRPYSIAVEKGDLELAEYFRALEPADFHSLSNKLLELQPYKLPKSLQDFLQGDSLRLEFGGDYDITFIEFFPLIDTVPFKLGRQKLLRISKETDDYDHIYVIWNPKTKMVAYYDMEHDELGDMAPFDAFIKDAGRIMQKVIDGEFIP